MPPHEAMERVAALADNPFTDFFRACGQFFARHLGKEPGAQFAIGNGVIEDDAA